MRAWEFLGENRSPPSKPVTLRALNKMKIKAKATARTEQKRLALMPSMYGNAERRREQLELERLRLELEQMKAEIAATQAETEAKFSTALTANAKSGIAAMEKSHDQITKLAKKGLGRRKKA